MCRLGCERECLGIRNVNTRFGTSPCMCRREDRTGYVSGEVGGEGYFVIAQCFMAREDLKDGRV